MQVVTWILSGVLAGGLAGRTVRGPGYGLPGSLVIGLAGGIIGGWLISSTVQPSGTAPLVVHVLASVLGGAMLVVAVRLADRATSATARRVQSGGNDVFELEAALRRLGALERRVYMRLLTRSPVATDSNAACDAEATFGQRLAEQVAIIGGSWSFILALVAFLVAWMTLNAAASRPVDPYPFIFLNFVVSCLAALQAPIILMRQNRQAAKNRVEAQNDYQVNLTTELQIGALHEKLDAIILERLRAIEKLQQRQAAVMERMASDAAAHGQP